jgi:hypothetical protein
VVSHVRDDIEDEKDAVPVCDPRVEVAMTSVRDEDVPYAKPDWVAFWPPVADIRPFRVAAV